MTTTMTLQAAADRVNTLEAELAAARRDRDRAIVAARASGKSLRAVAAEAHVTPEWVRRVADEFGEHLSTREAIALSGLSARSFLKRAMDAGVRMVEVDGQPRFRRADIENL